MILAVEDVDKAEDEYGGHVEGEGDQEHEEVAVVPSSWKWTILLFYVSRLPYSLWPGLRSQYIFEGEKNPPPNKNKTNVLSEN